MNDDVECPYCGEGQEINHDDGYGYEEDRRHEQQCGSCEKHFVFTTSISFYYEAEKADYLKARDSRIAAAAKVEMLEQLVEACVANARVGVSVSVLRDEIATLRSPAAGEKK